MDKTAMAQLLDQLKLQLGAEKLSQMIDDSFWMDLERQQIESSYERGRVDAMLIENGVESKFQSGSDYYQSKYTKGG